jgi:hypothetical protein
VQRAARLRDIGVRGGRDRDAEGRRELLIGRGQRGRERGLERVEAQFERMKPTMSVRKSRERSR